MSHDQDIENLWTEIRRLFTGMDAKDEAAAIDAMNEASALMQQHGLSFRVIMQRLDEHGLLLPTNLDAAIQRMETTSSEAANALRGARTILRNLNLTFSRIINAYIKFERLDRGHQAALNTIEQLQRDHQAAVTDHQAAVEENKRIKQDRQTSERKVQQLDSDLASLRDRVNMFIIVAVLLSIAVFALGGRLWALSGTLSDKPTPIKSDPPPPPPPLILQLQLPPPPPPPPCHDLVRPRPCSAVSRQDRMSECARREYRDLCSERIRDPSRSAPIECWRDRSIRGPCFD